MDQLIEIAVEDRVDVPDLVFAAMVFDALLRMQGVGTDLIAKADLTLLTLQLGELANLFLSLALEQVGAQHLHGRASVLVLRALVLALHDDPAGQMRNTNGRVGFVDVLPPAPLER